MSHTYYIHDNGGRPFKVVITKTQVTVLRRVDMDKYAELLTFDKPKQIFIGKSPLNAMTKFSGGHGRKFDGNSILLDMGRNTYVFIGETIYTFQPKSPIVSFVSPVGNSDSPLPYAIDSEGRYYLMVMRKRLDKIPTEFQDHPYDWLWGEGLTPQASKKRQAATPNFRVKVLQPRL